MFSGTNSGEALSISYVAPLIPKKLDDREGNYSSLQPAKGLLHYTLDLWIGLVNPDGGTQTSNIVVNLTEVYLS